MTKQQAKKIEKKIKRTQYQDKYPHGGTVGGSYMIIKYKKPLKFRTNKYEKHF